MAGNDLPMLRTSAAGHVDWEVRTVKTDIKRKYSGMMAPMVTPFTEDGKLDEGALARLTNFLIGSGIHMLFPTCTTGEAWTLTAAERRRVWEIVVRETKGRVPVLAGTGVLTTKESVDLTRVAETCGVDGVIVITPYYLAPPNDEELFQHFSTVARSTGLPMFPYNHPIGGGPCISPDLVERLATIPNVIGMKDGRDLALTIEYIRRAPPDFVVWQGPDNLTFPGLVMGCVGAIPAVANLVPEVCVKLYDAFLAGDWAKAMEAQATITRLRNSFALGTFPVVLKEAMGMKGMSVGSARAPTQPLTAQNKQKLRAILETTGVL